MSTMLMDLNVDPNLYPAASITKGALEFARMRLLDAIKELTPEQLEATPAHFSNSIATLVVHIAAIEVRFSHLITGKPLPEELAREFLLDQPQSPLPVAKGETAATLQAKLEKSMGYVDEMLRGLNVIDDYINRYPQIKIAETSMYLNQMYASTIKSIGVISLGGAVISLLIVSLITVLTLRLIIARSRKEIQTMSVLGFRLNDIKAQLLWQMGLISIVGIIIGLIFANTFGETLSGLLLSSLGGSGFRFIVHPLLSYMAIPLLFLAAILLSSAIVLNRSFVKGAK